jgi:hypothetical protein
VDDPLSSEALARIRWHLRALRDHFDIDDVEQIAVFERVVLFDVLGRWLLTHDVPGAGRGHVASWAASLDDAYFIAEVLFPRLPRPGWGESVGAIPVIVFDGERPELTFLLNTDLEVPT